MLCQNPVATYQHRYVIRVYCVKHIKDDFNIQISLLFGSSRFSVINCFDLFTNDRKSHFGKSIKKALLPCIGWSIFTDVIKMHPK